MYTCMHLYEFIHVCMNTTGLVKKSKKYKENQTALMK